MLSENFAIISLLITLIGGGSYIVDTLKGKIQPNKISWLFWAIAPLIAFSAQISQGVGLQSLLAFSVGFIPALVFIVSFINQKSYWKLEKFDLLCGAFSLLGLFLWWITKIGNLAILFSIFSDVTASIPTLSKALKNPESENDHVFWANTLSAIITMLTIKQWDFQTSAFPIYIFLMMGLIAFVIRFKISKYFIKINKNDK